VSAARIPVLSPEKGTLWKLRALSYFELSDRLLSPSRVALIAVGGLSGTGKSMLASAIAPDFLPEPGAVLLQSDRERKAMLGVDWSSRLPETAYTKEVSEAVYKRLEVKAEKAIGAGFTTVVDAVFASEAERNAIESVAAAQGIPFMGLFLTADIETRLRRVKSRQGDVSDADQSVVRMQSGYDLGRISWIQIDASREFRTTLKAARVAIGKELPALPLNHFHLACREAVALDLDQILPAK
jgi:predicted kinase